MGGAEPRAQSVRRLSQAQQAEFLNQGESMAWRDPRICSFAQFLLTDAGPSLLPVRQPEAPYFAFEFPLWLPRPRHGRHVAVWAQIRPAPHTGTLKFRRRGSGKWTDVAHFAPSNAEGYVSTSVRVPPAGTMRLRWDRGLHRSGLRVQRHGPLSAAVDPGPRLSRRPRD